MKNLKLTIAVLAISLSATFSAFAGNPEADATNSKLQSELTALLGHPNIEEVPNEIIFRVSFMLNNNDEIVVVSVNSKSTYIDSFVKSKLNYKKIAIKGIKRGEIYTLPVKIV